MHTCMCPWGPEEDIGFSEAGDTGGHELHSVGAWVLGPEFLSSAITLRVPDPKHTMDNFQWNFDFTRAVP